MESLTIEPFGRFAEGMARFLPNLLNAVLIFAAGVLLAILLKFLVAKIFKALGVDEISEKYSLTAILRKGGIKEPVSILTARLVGWAIVLLFGSVSLWALNIPAVGRLIEKFFVYLPHVFVAAVILLFGYVLGNFLGRAALIAAVNAGSKVSGLIGKIVKFTVVLLSATMAFEQLGIGKIAALIAFGIIFGGVVFAFALSFGLGGRDIAREYLEKKIRGEEKKDEIQHL